MQHWMFTLLLIFGVSAAQALSPQSFVFAGRIIAPDGAPLESSNVLFTVEVRSPGGENCLLYSESHSLNMSLSDGYFSLPVGSASADRTGGPGPEFNNSLSDVFNNAHPLFSGLSCSVGSTFVPASGQTRKIILKFDDGQVVSSVAPVVARSLPYAEHAYTVGGKTADEFIQVDTPNNLTQPNLRTVFSNFTELQALLNGTSLQYVSRSDNGASQLPSFGSGTPPTTPSAGDIWYDSDNNQIKYYNGTITETVGTSTPTLPDVGTAGTYTKVTTDSKGRVTAGTTLSESDIPELTSTGNGVDGGAITTGTIGGDTNIDTTGTIQVDGLITASGGLSSSYFQSQVYRVYDSDNSNYVELRAADSVGSNYTLKLPNDAGNLGEVLSTNGSDQLSWVDVSETSIGDVTSAAGEYFSYMPNNIECGDGEVLKWQAASDRWSCAADSNTDAVGSVFGRTGSVVAQSGDYTASQITNAPTGGISASTVQAALNELDTDKQNTDADLTGLAGLSTTGLIERTGAGTYATSTVTAAGKALLDDASGSAQRTTLGLGSLATQSAGSVSITGGAIDGTAIGGTTAASGAFTTLDSSSNASVGGALGITGNTTVGGTFTVAGDTSFSGNVDVVATKTVGIGAFTNADQATLVSGLVAGDEGKFWYNSDTNTLMYWNGSGAAALEVAGAGLQSLSGDTTSAQTLSISNGAAVLAPAWNHDGSGDHELRLPLASSAGVTHGLISKTDYDNFSSKQGSSLANGQILIGNGSNVATSRTPNGDLSLSNTGVFTLSNSGVSAGTYKSVTVDTKGRVTSATNPTTLSGFGINNAVENASGVPSIQAGADAAKGGAGDAGHLYVATDTEKIYRDNGTTWDIVGTTSADDIDAGTLNAARLPTSGVSAGTYKSVTVDNKGRVTSATNPTTLTGFGISDGVKNAGNTPSIQAGADASKGSAGTPGRVYISTDTQEIFRDNGTSWVLIASASGGSGDFMADGSVAMTGEFRAAAGTQLSPSITFAGDPDTGFFSASADQVEMTFAGSQAYTFTASNIYAGTGEFRISTSSSAGFPTYTFHGDANTGMYRPADNEIAFSNNGTESVRINSTGDLGIGTTNPGAKLEVAGQIKITGGSPGNGKVLTSDGSGLATWETPSPGGTGDFKADGTVAMSANLNVGNNKIINLATPSLPSDAATKSYVDSGLGSKQNSDADLTSLAALTGTGFVERTGSSSFSTYSVTTAGKNLLDDASTSAQRTTLGLGSSATRDTGSSIGDVPYLGTAGAANALLAWNTTGTAIESVSCSEGEYLNYSAGSWSCSSPPASSSLGAPDGDPATVIEVDNAGIIILGNGDGGIPTPTVIRGAAGVGSDTSGADITFDASNGTGAGGSGDFVFRTASANGVASPPVFDSSSSGTNESAGANSLAFSHTTGSSSNRLLLVSVMTTTSDETPTSVTYGGQSMSLVVTQSSGTGDQASIYQLLNPPSGADTVSITFGTNVSFAAVAASFSNVDSAQPLGTSVTSTTSSNPHTESVASGSTELVFTAMGGPNINFTADGSQTVVVNRSNSYGRMLTTTAPGQTTTNLTFTKSSPQPTALVSVPIRSASGSASTVNSLTERMRIKNNGFVGIGTSNPTSKLKIEGGAAVGANAQSNATTTIDFSTSNLQYTSSSCGGFDLHNLKDGGTYSFAVQGTSSATCVFNAYSDDGSTPLTVHLPSGHGATVAGEHTLYSIMVMGTHAYFAWIKEFD